MKTLSKEWSNITRPYLGNTWVRNEKAVLTLLMKQQNEPPLSLEQARAQVQRLKDHSASSVKKGRYNAWLIFVGKERQQKHGNKENSEVNTSQ